MKEIKFYLDDDDYTKLAAEAKLARREPVPQAEVYVLEALKSWPKKAKSNRTAHVVTAETNGGAGE